MVPLLFAVSGRKYRGSISRLLICFPNFCVVSCSFEPHEGREAIPVPLQFWATCGSRIDADTSAFSGHKKIESLCRHLCCCGLCEERKSTSPSGPKVDSTKRGTGVNLARQRYETAGGKLVPGRTGVRDLLALSSRARSSSAEKVVPPTVVGFGSLVCSSREQEDEPGRDSCATTHV